ncbi:MAG: hypothetical protein IPL76_10045 [Gemmatimonadetes bacterium]|nr:hypothetical protein [Gemmatimonadota bacterium]
MLTSVGEKLAAFDQAMDATATARRQHVRAARALEEAGNELNQVVRVLDGFNRFRFAKEPDLLAAWRSAANVLGPSRPATPDEPTTRCSSRIRWGGGAVGRDGKRQAGKREAGNGKREAGNGAARPAPRSRDPRLKPRLGIHR